MNQDYKKTAKDHLDKIADRSDFTIVNCSPSFVAWLCNQVASVGKPLKVLDFGCDSVIIGKQLCETFSGIDYRCYDLSETAIKKCKKNSNYIVPKLGSSAHFKQGEALEELSKLDENSMDVLLFLELFTYLNEQDIKKALNLAYKCIRPGGRVFIVDVDEIKVQEGYRKKKDSKGNKVLFRPLDYDWLVSCVAKMPFKIRTAGHFGTFSEINYQNLVFHTSCAYRVDSKKCTSANPETIKEQKALSRKQQEEVSTGDNIHEKYVNGIITATQAESEMREQLSLMFTEQNQALIRDYAGKYFILELGK